MVRLEWLRTFEGLVLAVVPATAILVSYLYQVGCYAFLDVPYELVELTTPKIIISIIALSIFFCFYAVVWMELFATELSKKWYGILTWHLGVNAVMTAFIWLRPRSDVVSNLGAMAFCLILFTAGTLWMHGLLSLRRSGRRPSLLANLSFGAYAIAIVFFVSIVAGLKSETKQSSRLVVKGANLVFVGTYNGQYVLKEFDPRTNTLVKDSALLSPADKPIVLERRKLRLRAPK